MTRSDKLSVFNAALTGLLASGHFSTPDGLGVDKITHVVSGDVVSEARYIAELVEDEDSDTLNDPNLFCTCRHGLRS